VSRTCRIQAASIARLRDRQCAMAVAVHQMRAHKKRFAPRESKQRRKEIAPAEVKHTTRFCLGAVHYPAVTYYSLDRSSGSVRQPSEATSITQTQFLASTSLRAIRTSTSSPQNWHKRKSGWRHSQPQVFENNGRSVREEFATHWFLALWSRVLGFMIRKR
jgi:hypothetical protein